MISSKVLLKEAPERSEDYVFELMSTNQQVNLSPPHLIDNQQKYYKYHSN